MSDTDRRSLANAILDITFGDMMDFSVALSRIFVNSVIDVSEPSQIAMAIHAWAKSENEGRN